jgi:hypothetical protein
VDLAAVLDSSAVADAPFEVGLRVGLDEGVNGSDVSSLVTTGSVVSASSSVFVVTAHADRHSYIHANRSLKMLTQ